MVFFKPNNTHPIKLRSFKKDLAPVGFYFDIFSTEIFEIPILPIPMRIDKLSNGEPTLFITPNVEKLDKVCTRLSLNINFNLFYAVGIKNFIKYAQLKQKEITLRNLDVANIRKWWRESNNIVAFNPDLIESFTFINSQFLKTFHYIEKNNLDPNQEEEEYKNRLIHYCDSIITYFRHKIEKNVFIIQREDKMEMEKLYLEKKNKFYPLVINIPVNDVSKNKIYDMGFVPYLIYDDLLDSFYYNKNLLENNKKDSINLKVYKDNEIINKRVNIESISTNLNTVEIKELKLEQLIPKLNIF